MKLAFKLPICAVGAAALSLAGAVAGSRWISATESQAATATVAAVPASGDGTLFTAFVSVLRNPRCMNCHSQGDFPRQGDDGQQYAMYGRHGPDVHVVTAQECSKCHQGATVA